MPSWNKCERIPRIQYVIVNVCNIIFGVAKSHETQWPLLLLHILHCIERFMKSNMFLAKSWDPVPVDGVEVLVCVCLNFGNSLRRTIFIHIKIAHTIPNKIQQIYSI